MPGLQVCCRPSPARRHRLHSRPRQAPCSQHNNMYSGTSLIRGPWLWYQHVPCRNASPQHGRCHHRQQRCSQHRQECFGAELARRKVCPASHAPRVPDNCCCGKPACR